MISSEGSSRPLPATLSSVGRALPLGTKLVLSGTLVTLLAVAGSFGILSLELRRQGRAHLREILAGNQRTVLELKKRNATELLWTSRLMTESPTLRAAMETYQEAKKWMTIRQLGFAALGTFIFLCSLFLVFAYVVIVLAQS